MTIGVLALLAADFVALCFDIYVHLHQRRRPVRVIVVEDPASREKMMAQHFVEHEKAVDYDQGRAARRLLRSNSNS